MTTTRLRGMLAGAALAALGGAPACGVQLEAADELLRNACRSDADCSGGAGQCAQLLTGSACVGTSAALPGLIIEVRPPASATYGAGTSHLFDVGKLMEDSDPEGLVRDPGITLSKLVQLGPGKVVVGDDHAELPCQMAAADRSIPVKVELRPVTDLVGLPLETYTAGTQGDTDQGYEFNLAVPPGRYEFYIQPLQTDACAGTDPPEPPLPPVYYGEQLVDDKDQKVNITLPEPSPLTGSIVVPEMASVDGWTLDVVEPTSGLVVSDVQTLTQDPLAFQVAIDLRYYRLFDPSPIIRLRPPPPDPVAPEAKPTAHWELDSANLFGTGNVELTLADVEAQAKKIDGRTHDADLQPVGAKLTFQSIEVSNGTGSIVTHRVEVETDPADGSYAVELLQGIYRVIARPKNDPTKALVVETWKIVPEDLGSGHDLVITEKTALSGRMLTPAEEALEAIIEASPPLPKPLPYLDEVYGLAPILPDSVSGSPDGAGAFRLLVDPEKPGAGQKESVVSFNFTVRTLEGSSYPWFVRPRVIVPPSGSDFGTLKLPYPAVLQGTVQNPSPLPGGVVADAVVRAWLPVENPNATDPEDRFDGTVILIGETTTDPNGRYVLPLPPSILK